MEKIKKDYKPKFVSLIAAIAFLSNSVVYGMDLSIKTNLRVPVVSSTARFKEALLRFEQVMSAPILDTDKYIIEELKLVFKLFGNIELKIVAPEELPYGKVLNIERNGNNSVVRIFYSERITAEGLIDLLGEIRGINSVERWIDIVFDLQDYFAQWSNILTAYSKDTNTPEDIRKEFIRLSRYFNYLEKKIGGIFNIQEEDGNILAIRYFGREANIMRVKKVIDHQLKLSKEGKVNIKNRIKMLENVLAHDLSKRLSDTFDRILIEKMFDEFISLVTSWDDPVARRGLLADISGEENVEELENWVEATRAQFKILTELKKESPEELQSIHIETAKRIGHFIKDKFPVYGSRVFHLADASDINKANCVAYSTMFYVISKEIGLDCKKIGVVNYNEDAGYEINHAAALVHLPAYRDKKSFILIELTGGGDIVSKPIQEDSVVITYQDEMSKYIVIPEKFYFDRLVEYADPLIEISDEIYDWGSDLINRHGNKDKMSRRIAERKLRMDPNNYRGLVSLGHFFKVGSAYLRYKAVRSYGYYKGSLRKVLNLEALRHLISLASNSGREKDYEEFCEELLQQYNTPEAYSIIAEVYKNKLGYKHNLEKAASILIQGNEKFPEDLQIIIGLSRLRLSLAERETDIEKKADMIKRGISDLEKAIIRNPEKMDFFGTYERYIRNSDERALKERYLKFCEEMKAKNPKAGMPIVYLMRSLTEIPTKEGFLKASKLAQEYLESTEPKNRVAVLEGLRKLYSPFSNVSPEYIPIFNEAYIGTLEDFLTYLLSLNEKFPESYAAIGAIADALVELQRYEDAVAYLKRYFAENYYSKDRKIALIKCLFQLRRWQEIVELEDDFISLDLDRYSTTLMTVGIAFQSVGEYKKAMGYFESFLEKFGGLWSDINKEHAENVADVKRRLDECRRIMNKQTNPLNGANPEIRKDL